LRGLLGELKSAAGLELQLVVTGMHLSPEFGLTYQEIEKDGFVIDERVDVLLSTDTAIGVSKSMGLGLIGFSDTYTRLKPDLLLVLGDRFEIFSAVAAAMIAGIPIAHLHGGESTEGAFDEAIRHSITKMSQLHFVAAEEYRRRVIQLGENPERVFLVGGLGVDAIKRIELLEKEALESSMDFRFGTRNLLVTFHPETMEKNGSIGQCSELLAALDQLEETHLIFTMPNADTGGRAVARMIDDFVSAHPTSRAYDSLGQLRYLSCMKFVDGVVGNSSSGLTEAPSMGVGTVNIGDRQLGRLKARSVIDVPAERDKILSAVRQMYTTEFQLALATNKNPYGEGDAVEKIMEVLLNQFIDRRPRKSFYDL